MAIQRFAGDRYSGLSTDAKPSNVINGAVFYETDTLKEFIRVSNVWSQLSGSAGASGYSGISGYSGYSGISGWSGISGYSGTNGTSGYSGISGYSGVATYNATPADHTASGLTLPLIAGEAITAGDLLCYKADGRVWKALASSTATMPCIGMAVTTQATAGQSVTVLLHGYFQDASLYNFTTGGQASSATGLLYVSNVTAGLATQTIVTTSTHIVQIVGYAGSPDIIFFNPNYTYIQLI